MIVSINNSAWIFEHKIFSKLSYNQLKKYRNSGKKRFDENKLSGRYFI